MNVRDNRRDNGSRTNNPEILATLSTQDEDKENKQTKNTTELYFIYCYSKYLNLLEPCTFNFEAKVLSVVQLLIISLRIIASYWPWTDH